MEILDQFLKHSATEKSGEESKSPKEVEKKTQRGNTCKSMAESCQCMAKTTIIL